MGTAAPAVIAPGNFRDAAKAWPARAGALRPVANGGWCLDAPSLTAGAAVTVQPCDGTANQHISVTVLPGTRPGYVELATATAAALCLAPDPATATTTAVVLRSCSAAGESQWWQESPLA
jgi:Ricin-type beta-trefoil lectin domain